MSLTRSPQWSADKAQARNEILAWRTGLTSMQRDALTQQVSANLQSRFSALVAGKSDGRCVGVYWPIRNEPDLSPLFESLVDMGFKLALPVTPDSPAPLAFLSWQPGEAMQTDKMGIAVPSVQRVVRPDILLIPCVGFGPNNIRLSYGGGYYDRTLADFSGITIGVAYAHTYLPALAAQPFDIPLQEIVTDATAN